MAKSDIIAELERRGIPHDPSAHWKTLESLLSAPAQGPESDTGTAPESEPAPAETPAESPASLPRRKRLEAFYHQDGKRSAPFYAMQNDDGTLNLYFDPKCTEIVVSYCPIGNQPGQATLVE